MTVRHRRSLLQSRILLELHKAPATTVTDLASRLGSKRPSVSRSLSVLKERGSVAQTGRSWSLTEDGHLEAMSAAKRLGEEITASAGAAKRRVIVLKDASGTERSFYRAEGDDMLLSQVSPLIAEKLDEFYGAGPGSLMVDRSADATLLESLDVADALTGTTLLREALDATGLVSVADIASSLRDFTIGDALRDSGVSIAELARSAAGIDDLSLFSGIKAALGSDKTSWFEKVLDQHRLDVFSTDNFQRAIGLSTDSHWASIAGAARVDMSSLFAESLAFDVSSILSPFAEAQSSYAGWLGGLHEEMLATLASPGLAAQLVGDTMSDILAAQRAEVELLAVQPSALGALGWIPERLMSVGHALGAIYDSELERFEASCQEIDSRTFDVGLALWSAPPSAFVRSTRLILEGELENRRSASASRPTRPEAAPFLGNHTLDERLASIDPALPSIRRGAWHAIEGDSPDRIRQAATSARELISQVVNRLHPDTPVFDRDVHGSIRKAKVTAIMSGSKSATEYVITCADSFNASYDYLSVLTHTNSKNVASVRALISMAESLVQILLAHALQQELE